jgi:hypothetical protein
MQKLNKKVKPKIGDLQRLKCSTGCLCPFSFLKPKIKQGTAKAIINTQKTVVLISIVLICLYK